MSPLILKGDNVGKSKRANQNKYVSVEDVYVTMHENANGLAHPTIDSMSLGEIHAAFEEKFHKHMDKIFKKADVRVKITEQLIEVDKELLELYEEIKPFKDEIYNSSDEKIKLLYQTLGDIECMYNPDDN